MSKLPISSTMASSVAVPQSVVSPVSTMASTPNSSTTWRMMSKAVGLRWTSLTCSRRTMPSVGWNVGRFSPARYSTTMLLTRSLSWARYSPKRSTIASTSPTAVGAAVRRPL